MVPSIHPAIERRVRWLLRALVLWGIAVALKLFYVQIVKHDYYADLADQQQTRLVEIPAHRGTIFDRNGHILAISVPVETVVVNPAQLPNVGVAAEILSAILGVDQQSLATTLQTKQQERRGYYRVAQNITQEQANRLKSLHLGWIQFESSSIRVYPNDQLAAHVLGGVDFEQQGNGGIEQGLDDELSGRPGFARVVTDVRHRGFESQVEVEPLPGNNVVLTIDYRIQYELEKQLAEAVEANHVWSGRAMVIDPHNGEILAMASYPTYNPNLRVNKMEARQNLTVQSAGEPGSVFKVFTIAAAIEEKTVKPSTVFHCGNGRFNLFGRVIHDASKGGYGYLSVEDTLAKSSNICTIQVGLTLGNKLLHQHLRTFGFGSPTGLPLPGESAGRLLRLSRWSKSSIGSVAMGHEVMTTTAQLAQGVSVIANGGKLIRPSLTRRIESPTDGPVSLQPASFRESYDQPQQILSPETVVTMRQMMERVVLAGTGKGAKIRGYSVGGKTGSAQIFDPKSKKYLSKYHASFVGFAPVNNPRLVTVITLNGSSVFGGVVAAPVFSKVTAAALRILNTPQDLPDTETASSPATQESTADAADAFLSEDSLLEDTDNSETIESNASFVAPNFIGLSLRGVLEQASTKGFRIDPSGSGIVRAQSPAPGEPVAYGQKIKVRLGR